jgi:DNA-binding response OmpR family regulator
MSAALARLPQPQPAPVVADRPCRVLIIDDDDALSEVLSYRLQKQGIGAAAAYSGAAGLARARAESFSAIVLDLCLPDADGLSICEQLTDSPETCSIPILILSGTDEPGIVRRCRAAGCRYFLRKPYDPNALWVLIRQAIRETNEWEAGSADGDE